MAGLVNAQAHQARPATASIAHHHTALRSFHRTASAVRGRHTVQVRAVEPSSGNPQINLRVQVDKKTTPTVADSFKATGKTAVLIGGAQGLGSALADKFARKGYNVVIAGNDAAWLEQIAARVNKINARAGSSMTAVINVRDQNSVAGLANDVIARFSSVDAVVCHSDLIVTGSVQETPLDDVAAVMQANFLAPVSVAKAFIPVLEMSALSHTFGSPRPTLVMVNNIGGRVPIKNMAAFCASKHALAGFTDCLRLELASKQVHVAHVHPGVIKNEIIDSKHNGVEAEENKRMVQDLQRSSFAQDTTEVASAIYDAVISGQDEVYVGPLTAAAGALYNTTHLNPFSFISPQ